MTDHTFGNVEKQYVMSVSNVAYFAGRHSKAFGLSREDNPFKEDNQDFWTLGDIWILGYSDS